MKLRVHIVKHNCLACVSHLSPTLYITSVQKSREKRSQTLTIIYDFYATKIHFIATSMVVKFKIAKISIDYFKD